MEEEKVKQIVSAEMAALLDKLDHCIISTRDSVPPSLSDVLVDIQKTLKEHGVKIDKMYNKFKMVDGFGGTILLLAKYAGAAAAIGFALRYFHEWIKK